MRTVKLGRLEIEPVYTTPSPNEPLLLGRETVVLSAAQRETTLEVLVTLRLLPRPRLVFEGHCPDPDLEWALFVDHGPQELRVRGKRFRGSVISVREGRISFAPSTEPIIVQSPEGKSIRYIVFHIFGFPEVILPAPRPLAWSVEGWRFSLAELPSTAALLKALKEVGGYAITHVGRVEREDGQAFDEDEAMSVLEALRTFFSFAAGRWTGPSLPVGFDDRGARVFEVWGTPPMDPFRTTLSWFDEHHPEVLSGVFPGFWRRYRDPLWRRALNSAIYWYLKSNTITPHIDAGIILSQAALELLAWMVWSQGGMTAAYARFRKMLASDKLRILLEKCGIPAGIPDGLHGLQSIAAAHGWKDGPPAITEVRNSLAHPRSTVGPFDSRVYYELWSLAQWYIELSLLRLLDYAAVYRNRLSTRRVGEVTPVPWAAAPSTA